MQENRTASAKTFDPVEIDLNFCAAVMRIERLIYVLLNSPPEEKMQEQGTK